MPVPELVDSDRLRSFVVFAEHENFTRAARVLGLTQPALHAQVQKLAEQVGAPLYRRVGRGLELTDAGRRVVRLGRDWLAQSAELKDEIAGRQSARAVTLAAGEGAYLYLLGGAIRRFLRQASVPLRLITTNREQTVQAVESGVADLGVAAFDRVPTSVSARSIADVSQVLVVPREHRLAPRARVRLGDLEGERLIVAPEGRPHRIELERALSAARVAWEPAVEAGGWELMLHFAKLGLGLAVVNGFCRIPAGLVARPLRELAPVRYSLLAPASGNAPVPVAWLERAIANECSDSG